MTHNASITNQNALPPAIVRTIHEAFDDVVKTLEIRTDSYMPHTPQRVHARIARHIVDLAKHGECDPDRLRDLALRAIRFDA